MERDVPTISFLVCVAHPIRYRFEVNKIIYRAI